MIDARELRIGNWVTQGVGAFQVTEISDANINIEYSEGGGHAWLYDLEDTDGIPLTPDILEKCGFLKTEANNTYAIDLKEYGLIKLYIAFSDGTSIFALGDCHSTKETIILIGDDNFQYLHQLQNLFYSLTNQELNIHL